MDGWAGLSVPKVLEIRFERFVSSIKIHGLQLVKQLETGQRPLDDHGPVHPRAMIVTATMFLLRELEASAIDMEDITLDTCKITLYLPVSKTDWQAKGCSRSWTCVCDTQLPCVFHILKDHVIDVQNFYKERQMSPEGRALFPTQSGGYCTKQGVVNTLRSAVELTGDNSVRGDGAWAYSGHAFRIAGARILARSGLDCITIQLLGRCGSNAILSYLAESPLDGFAERLHRGLSRNRLEDVMASNSSPEFRRADELVFADDMMKELRQSQDGIAELELQVQQLQRGATDTAEILEGMDLVISTRPETEMWSVDNTDSKVRHRSVENLSSPPATWKTMCGWNFSS